MFSMEKVAVLMDVDGTIIQYRDGTPASTWRIMFRVLGIDSSRSLEYMRRYREVTGEEKEKLIREWIEHDLGEINKKYRKGAVDAAMRELVYAPGLLEFVEYARRRGWKIGLVSAGFSPLLERIAQELGVEVLLSLEIREREGRFEFEYVNIIDVEEKRKKVEEFQAGGYYVVYIGDGPNDREALAAADLGICIGGDTKADYHADDFYEVREIMERVLSHGKRHGAR